MQVNGTGALQDEAVAAGLKLTDEQKEQLQKVRDGSRQAFMDAGLRDLDEEARTKKIEELTKDRDDQALAVLTDDQRATLDKMKGAELKIDPANLPSFGRGGGGSAAPTRLDAFAALDALAPRRSLIHNGGMNDAATTLSRPRGLNLLLAATTLLSAWLLFQVQPMVAKRILPWFGGGAAIWTTTMLFFQAALFVGYLYAHLVAKSLPSRTQVRLHCGLLAVAAALVVAVGVIPPDSWQPGVTGRPALRILATLAGCVGLPYLVLAATAPLVQVWFSRANPGRSPYRLYAISNLGSLAALLSYPLLLEPNLGVMHQGVAWSALFVLFAVSCGASGLLSLRSDPAQIDDEAPDPRKRANRSPSIRLLDRPARVRLGAAARHHRLHLSEHRADSAAVDHADGRLPDHVHPHVR